MQNFLSHFNLMFSIFWFNILSIILILGLIVPLHYLFFLFIPSVFCSFYLSVQLDIRSIIFHIILYLYTLYMFLFY